MMISIFRTLLLPLIVCSSFAGDWMHFPAYERAVFPNGVTVLLMEKHDAPLIHLNLALRSGSTQDPAGREGLAEITNQLLRKGAGARSASQLSEALDFIGATLETVTSLETTTLQLDCLSKDLPTALELFTDMTLHPQFPPEEIGKLVKQNVDEIKAAKDEPLEVIGPYYQRLLFQQHPYGRPPSGDELSLQALTRDEIVHFHRDTYVSSNLVLIAVGDFQIGNLRQLFFERFGKLPPAPVKANPVPKTVPVARSRLLLVDKPDSSQTFFALGNTGIAVHDPDRLALDLVNTLFGGRFTSRLNSALRIDSGLSYGARSTFTPLWKAGSFAVSSFTRNESTEQALDAAVQVLRHLHQDGITQAELDSARSYLKGQFGLTLETPAQLAARLAYFEVYALSPKEEVDQYAARLEAISLEDTRRAIRKSFPETNLVFAVIGKAESIAPLLKKYATDQRTVSIDAPGFGSAQ